MNFESCHWVFLFFCAMDPRKIAVGIDDASWFVCLFIYHLNLSPFFKVKLMKQTEGHAHTYLCKGLRGGEV